MRITKSGRITIPKKLRERLGLGEGVEVAIFPKPSMLFIRTWPPEDALPEIVDMVESRIIWEHHLSDDPSDDGDACSYGVRALVRNGKIAIPRVYRERYGFHDEEGVDFLLMSNGMLMQKCAPKQASTRKAYKIPESVVGSLKRSGGIMGGLYDNVDDYIRDIRGH